MSSWGAGFLFNIPQSPLTVKGAIRRPALLQNPGSFLKQDVCLRPPSPQINNPQNLILGGRVEALESHYFHIPYPGAVGLLRECGRPDAGKAQPCSGNLRPCARLQGEMSPYCVTLGSVWQKTGFVPCGGEGDIADMLVTLWNDISAWALRRQCIAATPIARCPHTAGRKIWYKLTVHCKVIYKRNRSGGFILKTPSKAVISAEAGRIAHTLKLEKGEKKSLRRTRPLKVQSLYLTRGLGLSVDPATIL